MSQSDPSTRATRRRVAIIGGGLSGLALGAHLKHLTQQRNDLDCDWQVFEGSERVGGVIHTETIDVEGVGRFVVDHGADMFAVNPSGAIDFCRQASVEERLLRPQTGSGGAMIARGNRLVPIPEGFVLMRATKLSSMLTTPLLSLRGKLRMLAERFVPRREHDVDDESVGDFVRRRLGKEVLDEIVAPLVAGIYTADVDQLSMASTMKPIWDMEASDGSLAKATLRRLRSGEDSTERSSSGARYAQFRAFPGGMIQLIETLSCETGLDRIRTKCPIEALEQTELGIKIHPTGETFDEVVLATPARVTANLLASLESSRSDEQQTEALETAVTTLRRIRYASTAIVVMGIPREKLHRLPKTFGFVVPPKEGRAILAGSFASEKFSGRAPENYVILRCFVGGVLQPQILTKTDESIVQIVTSELGELIGLEQGIPIDQLAAFVRVVRWNDAMPQYEVGHAQLTQRIEQAVAKIDGVHVLTNAIGGVGIAPVIGRAQRLAQRIFSTESSADNRA